MLVDSETSQNSRSRYYTHLKKKVCIAIREISQKNAHVFFPLCKQTRPSLCRKLQLPRVDLKIFISEHIRGRGQKAFAHLTTHFDASAESRPSTRDRLLSRTKKHFRERDHSKFDRSNPRCRRLNVIFKEY